MLIYKFCKLATIGIHNNIVSMYNCIHDSIDLLCKRVYAYSLLHACNEPFPGPFLVMSLFN